MFTQNATILAGLPQATLQAYLATAQQAYADLMTGQKTVSVGYDGKNVTYAITDSAKLESWIDLLQRCLGMNRGRRALRPYYR